MFFKTSVHDFFFPVSLYSSVSSVKWLVSKEINGLVWSDWYGHQKTVSKQIKKQTVLQFVWARDNLGLLR